MKLILASSSKYRKELLQRLNLEFQTDSPDIDERPKPNEAPIELVKRLSIEKAKVLSANHPNALIIGSDQIILTADGEILGKPHNHANAVDQLTKVSGSEVELITGLALYNTASENLQYQAVRYQIGYRDLSAQTIEAYLTTEKPYDCAGALKSEGLGISLLNYLRGDDPTAIIGLPLIQLTQMLLGEGVNVPTVN